VSVLGWLVQKDLKVFFADRQGALMTVLVPVVLASFLGMLFAPRSSNTVLKLLVVSSEQAPPVKKLIAAIGASENFEVEEVDEATARDRVAKGKASLALFLPPGTAEALRPETMFQGERGHAELLYDPSDEVEANMARGLLIQVLMEQTMGSLSDPERMGDMFDNLEKKLEPGSDPALRDFIHAGRSLRDRPKKAGTGTRSAMEPPLSFDKVAAAPSGPAQGYNSYAHNYAGMLLMFLLFAAQARAKQLVVERDSGTLVRLRLSSASNTAILLGVGASTTLIALIASAVVYATGILVFGIRISGPLIGFLGVVVAQALFVGGFALLLAGLGRTEEQISSLGPFVVLVMCFAGGAMFPSFMMPGWLRSASLVLPTYWATDGLAAMTWRGLGLPSAALPIAFLLGWAALCAFVGVRRFRFGS
jgi:ABC-2 type transport system permease protein